MVGSDQKTGILRKKIMSGKNCLLLTSHLGLCQCLVVSCNLSYC